MTALRKPDLVGLEDYLATEADAPVKSEFLAGEVYAMAGCTAVHNQLAGALYAAFLAHLKGKPCRTFISDMKVKLRYDEEDTVYYPDVMVDCSGLVPDAVLATDPTVVVEVLSQSTERTDRREKWFLYRNIPALQEYVLIDQSRPEVTVFRRSAHWSAEVLDSPDAVVDIQSIGFRCTVGDIYAGVPLPGEKLRPSPRELR
ncbi:MAG: Uma2 family endonuclease [Terrimicrobiaceae bacterium]